MPIITRIDGSPASLRGVATWLRTALQPVADEVGSAVAEARRHGSSSWQGDAAEAFRAALAPVIQRADDTAAGATQAASELDVLAAALESAQAAMSDIRAAAQLAGLTLTADAILEPPPVPPVGPDPALAGVVTTQEVQRHSAQVGAARAARQRIDAYNIAAHDAAGVRERFEAALVRSLEILIAELRDWTNWADTAVLATELTFARYVSSARQYVADLRAAATAADAAYLRAPGGSAEAMWQERLRLRHTSLADDVARHADGLAHGRIARLFGGRVPVVGAAVTVAGVGWSIHEGTSPSTAIVGATAGALATAGVVAAVGGPVGWVVGAGIVVGVGVGLAAEWAWENWVSEDVRATIDQGIEDMWNATTGAVSTAWASTTDAVGDAWDSVTSGIGDAWDAIF